MKGLSLLILVILMAGCADDELTLISIRNRTELPIYALPYSSEFTNADWIAPGGLDEFYSINCDCLDGFEYFSFYYDSLIVIMKDHEDDPIKFYKDGTAVNYDPTLNPFTNPKVWNKRKFDLNLPGGVANSDLQETHISEHFFCIDAAHIKSLADTTFQELYPAH